MAGLLVYATCRKDGAEPLLSALGACIFAFSRLAWDQSVVAEVYALNAAFVAGTLFALTCWLRSGQNRHFLWAVGVYAFSFGNHLTMVTLLPAFVGALLLGNWRPLLNNRTALQALLLVALGAAQYSYLFFASSSDSLYLEYRVSNWDEFVNFVSGDHYRRRMFAFDAADVIQTRVPLLARTILRDLGLIAFLIPVGILVWIQAGSKSAHFKTGAVFLLALGGESFWYLNYNIPDIEIYSIPVALAGKLCAIGALRAVSQARSPYLRVLSLSLAALSVGWSLHQNEPDHTKSVRFEKMVEKEIDAAGEDSVIVGRIHYDERMGWVYRLFVDNLARKRNLFIDHNASPARVLKYLKGKGQLRDFYTGEPIAPGKRVFLTARGYTGQRWGSELSTNKVVGPLHELTLRTARGQKSKE